MAANELSVPNNQNLEQLKESMFDNIRYRLGDGIVDLELDPEHYEAAYNYAIKTTDNVQKTQYKNPIHC